MFGEISRLGETGLQKSNISSSSRRDCANCKVAPWVLPQRICELLALLFVPDDPSHDGSRDNHL